MSSNLDTVQYLMDQADLGEALAFRKMFGEYALYLSGKVVGFVCDNQLFLKPTPEGRRVLGEPLEGAPYPGARNHFLLRDEIEDRELLRRALRATEAALPWPVKRTRRASSEPPAGHAKRGRA